MTDEDALLRRRLEELAERAAARSVWTYSEFLSLAGQEVLAASDCAAPAALWGGYDGAERKIAVFGSEELCGYPAQPPVCCVRLAPASQKFADALTHRDFLGALMNLGVRRETTGDIAVLDNCGYLFCLESVADYLTASADRVRHTVIRAERLEEPPEILNVPPEIRSVVVASERLDALVAAVYDLPRGRSQELIGAGRVCRNGREETRASAEPKPGEIVSVRGMGRFQYVGPSSQTRRGRLRVDVRVYG